MNTEMEIVRRRPFSFTATVLGAGCTPIVTTLVGLQEKSVEDISTTAWVVMIVGGVVSGSQAVRAWFSTSAARARDEIENGGHEQSEKASTS